ncbi:DUF808 domain-containing protein [Corynebacterium sp. sy017]|uniref:DUF808 domain-containing protein n=1 Tax=unclassified Corynebacterium TaxID=2624378 RepID=UPI0011860D04|nr:MULTISPECIES: DUF808 domain-containing protein [unclassified Corynebacterium]MBP3088936.1 DUF808 domain-containing protein [Corynebacterium sp. sy017]QDZ42312.1 DUF808 domain-containing protein [Corynebacterium sp. sy039]TSD91264.1 DUF808 domain-containing protein [Corynebacterium sp. SY003]
MAGGLAALLDDVALIAKTAAASIDDVAAQAAKTSAKAAGVVIDDTAVTPRFVEGVTPARELPIIWRIARGSLFNKLIIILPIALLLNAIAPWALTPILMVGGAYLCFEGAEKIIEMFSHSSHEDSQADSAQPKDEKTLVRGAITTDLILSAEIMVISLNEVANQPLWMEASVLIMVAFVVTLLVYGAVGLLVKIDDFGLALGKKDNESTQKIGRALVVAMPKILNVISIVGMFAMLWVGGHILITGLAELGFPLFHDLVEHVLHAIAPNGGLWHWLVETFLSLVFGTVVGGIIAVIMQLFHKKHA